MEIKQTKSEAIDLIREKTTGTRIATFITSDATLAPKARPMVTQEIDERGIVTFITDKHSKKINEIKNSPKVTLSYTPGNDITFVNLTGNATIVEDREKIKQLWSSFHEAWFDGPTDPRITLIEVEIERLEYWDYAGGKVGAYVDMALSALTGKKADGDENEKITIA